LGYDARAVAAVWPAGLSLGFLREKGHGDSCVRIARIMPRHAARNGAATIYHSLRIGWRVPRRFATDCLRYCVEASDDP